MPALSPTSFFAKIIWLGAVVDRGQSLRATSLNEIEADFAGYEPEAHAGRTRASCARVSALYKTGTEIANVRQFSILSAEELGATASALNIDRIDPSWIGASMVVEGIPDFTHIPPSARLQSESGATLTVDMENRPCSFSAREVASEAGDAAGKGYKAAAQGRRGVTAWVERPGTLAVGDQLRLFVPTQPTWPHLADALKPAG